MAGKLKKYASSSDLMNVHIIFGDERFRFNLYEEVIINENNIESEIMQQPSSYSFLIMLRTKLKRNLADSEFELQKTYGRLFAKLKKTLDRNTGRPPSDDFTVAQIHSDEEYEEAHAKVRELQFNVNIIDSCVRSFEQRKDLIQTLSANLRRENH